MDDLTWALRVRATGTDQATVYARQHRFTVGVPVQFDEQYDQVTALEYALAALGADLVNGLRLAARRRRFALTDVEAVVTGALDNPLTYLGVVGEEGHPGLTRVTIRVYVSTDAAAQDVASAWREAQERSPLVRALRSAVALELSIDLVP
jgi:uncharacterized OsmC-like protein